MLESDHVRLIERNSKLTDEVSFNCEVSFKTGPLSDVFRVAGVPQPVRSAPGVNYIHYHSYIKDNRFHSITSPTLTGRRCFSITPRF